ncbi:MAG: phosphoribosyltransferase family protein [Eubacteriales bacterium]|nr:adenine phosphoribosyltransferase [Christensenellaceae bacterium]MDY2751865.1 phosphoribosyltransferase family protein [Eubacteriales bacterium]MCI7769406.1 adenine phosphoribosyltransferase [Christensenellaceae bacterium]MDD6361101.1 phosphoribosyltransferase family protein [Christensenellaceae bacterium]MDD7092521.1 phosphoribosyltransferase family protein [Christensenellaceae bacterium]
MDKYYRINIAGLERDLPICPINEHLYIAGFVMFSDVEMTVRCAEELLKRAPEHDLIITAESKGIPLAYEMAKQEGKNYILARKGLKAYMTNPIKVEVKSITTAKVQTLYLDECDVEKMKGKRILIVDDVISTGESLHAIEELVNEAGGNIVGKMAVLAEGDAADRHDIIFLQKLPLFFK